MKGSRVNFWAVLLLLLAQGVAAAEDQSATGAPKGLAPPSGATSENSEPASTPSVGVPEVSSHEEVLPDQVGKPSGPKVTVSGLEAIDPSGAGIIDHSSGGFPASIYSGSPRLAISTRISQLAAAPNSPAMQGLIRRLLLSTTRPPAGTTPPGEPSLLAQRLRVLLAGGRVSEVSMLGAQSASDDQHSRALLAEAMLLLGRDEDACGDATALRQTLNDDYWLKLRAYCQIVSDEVAAASLTLDVMHERGVDDPAFFALASAITDGSKVKLDALAVPSGLHLAMMRRLKISVPASLASWLPAYQQLTQHADPTMRLAAFERAAAAGLLPVEDLRQAYADAEFTADQYDDPEEFAAKLAVSQANALYFQAISKRTQPAAQAAAFAAALDRADSQNRFALFAQLARGAARKIPPMAETAWLAPNVFRVLMYNGDAKQASAWLALLNSPTDAGAVNALRIQSAVVYPSAENLAHLPSAISWLGEQAQKPGGGAGILKARALREIPLLEALGYTIPPEAQWAVTSAGPAPAGAAGEALTSLLRSAQQQRVGETILNALVALGNSGPSRAPVHVVARVVDALAMIGMRDEARAIASEAITGSSSRPVK